jgi:hypothetical protein
MWVGRYESRSTSAGSIRDARYAGSPPAPAQTVARATAAPMSVNGSRASKPFRSVAMNFDAIR